MDRNHRVIGVTRRGMLSAAAALTASGWIGGAASGWVLRPRGAHAAGPIKVGIATDITGAIAAGATPTGRSPSSPSSKSINRAASLASRLSFIGRYRVRPENRCRQRSPADPGAQSGCPAGRHHQRHAAGDQGPHRHPRPHPLHLSRAIRGSGVHQDLFCTGRTPAQQCNQLIPYIIKTLGKKRFAMPSPTSLAATATTNMPGR